jgi:hypothetical protein
MSERMSRHRYTPLSEDLGLPPELRNALNHNGQAFEEEFEDLRRGQIDLGTSLTELQTRFDGVYSLMVQSVDASRRLTEQCQRIANRFLSELQPDLPPMRDRAITYGELERVMTAASSPGQSIPSVRVREVVERVMGAEKLRTFEESSKELHKLKIAVIGTVSAAVIVSALTFLWGHLEGRAMAPRPAASSSP